MAIFNASMKTVKAAYDNGFAAGRKACETGFGRYINPYDFDEEKELRFEWKEGFSHGSTHPFHHKYVTV